MRTAATILAWSMGVHVLVKFTFFALPYARRRAALDRAYSNQLSATAASDRVLLLIVVVLAVILFLAGVNAVSFLTGLWIGATLIQTYFHRYDEPLAPGQAPLPPAGPIKLMSYAIQADPWRPWPQIAALTVLILASFVALVTG
ncbi:MAG: hypothetical protein JO153_10950 [Solirubrobacterales bacterium]|nr:hypothetical protein [Solirubrobacterales bacterium]MBV9334761.1 hypothetical protein [Solirubrobacterales bacterium]MBV9917007.1 hypothetical protein [Solirubrobacterales bacterium]